MNRPALSLLRIKAPITLAAAFGLLTAGIGGAATMPVSETFDDDPTGAAPPTTQGGAWTEDVDADDDWTVEIDGAGRDYRSVTVGEGNTWDRPTAILGVTGVQGNEFTLSYEFEVVDYTGPLNHNDFVRTGGKLFTNS